MTGAQRLNGGENGWSVSLFLGEEHYSVAHSTSDDFQHAQGAPPQGASLSRPLPPPFSRFAPVMAGLFYVIALRRCVAQRRQHLLPPPAPASWPVSASWPPRRGRRVEDPALCERPGKHPTGGRRLVTPPKAGRKCLEEELPRSPLKFLHGARRRRHTNFDAYHARQRKKRGAVASDSSP